MTPVLATIVALTNLMGTVEIDTRGARVTSYVPIGGSEVFFASETGTGGRSAGRGLRAEAQPVRSGTDLSATACSRSWATSATRPGTGR